MPKKRKGVHLEKPIKTKQTHRYKQHKKYLLHRAKQEQAREKQIEIDAHNRIEKLPWVERTAYRLFQASPSIHFDSWRGFTLPASTLIRSMLQEVLNKSLLLELIHIIDSFIHNGWWEITETCQLPRCKTLEFNTLVCELAFSDVFSQYYYPDRRKWKCTECELVYRECPDSKDKTTSLHIDRSDFYEKMSITRHGWEQAICTRNICYRC